MDHLGYWRLLDALTIEQAALLILDQDPENALDTRGYGPVANAIEAGLHSNAIDGVLCMSPEYKMRDSKGQQLYRPEGEGMGLARVAPSIHHMETNIKTNTDSDGLGGMHTLVLDHGQRVVYVDSDISSLPSIMVVDHGRSFVYMDSLKDWLKSKGFRPAFFFPDNKTGLDYMSPDHPRYSAKLAAAVKVWEAMADENLYSGKSPKRGMETWLKTHYKELGLVWKEKINGTGIEEVAKVANWIEGGGAPTTPNDG